WIYLFYFFGDQAKLRNLIRIEFLLVAKGNWFERKDSFAGSIHRLDCILETRRGNNRAELAGGIDHHAYPGAAGYGLAIDAGDVGGGLRSLFTYGNLIGIPGFAEQAGTDNDVIAAGGKILACLKTNGNVIAAAYVLQ